MWKYDVSIIVAIYNSEKYVRECIESIIQQKYDLNKIQILLIDDGSTDKSYEICEEYAKQYPQISLIRQENKGVSAARNVAIKKAEGKYIMILDSDDFISSNAVKELVSFMNQHSELDISSYTMLLCSNDKKTNCYRNEMYCWGTGIYSLEEFPYLSQASVNIIFKNEKDNNLLYNENMEFSEDEQFNTRICMKKVMIGFCKEATYYYRQHATSVTKTRQNPYYCFEQLINYLNFLINTYIDKKGKLPRYIQGLIIQAISWRIREDIFLPYYLSGKEYEEAIEKIKTILKNIEIDIILNKPNMEEEHKYYLLKLKGIDFEFEEGYGTNFLIKYKNKVIYADKKIQIVFNRFNTKDNRIKMLGYIKSPVCEIIKPTLYIKINNLQEQPMELTDSNLDYYKTKIRVTKFYKFEYELELSEIKNFKFLIKLKEKFIPIEIAFNDKCDLNGQLNRLKILDKTEKYIVEFNKFQTLFKVEKVSEKEKKILKKELINLYNKINPKINFFRMLAKTEKAIWLYCDRKGIIDNGYYQFKHDITKKDGVKRYYIIDGDKKEFVSYFSKKEMRRFLIKKDSLRHKIMFLRSSKILSSFSSNDEYSPFKISTLKWYQDILKYDLIYLQHGILYANLLKLYGKEFTEIDKIVISSNFEEDNLINKYKYSENDLIRTGMPRFDIDTRITNKKNKILFAPSWRVYLIGDPPINGKRELKESVFLNSKFYKEISEFLNDEKLDKVLEENKIELHFKLHPIFEPYKELFNLKTKNIKLISGNVENKEYNLFITDFSSFQFDFAYLNTPIIYFIPDMMEFKAGLHSYRELDFPLNEAFGDVIYRSDELAEKIKSFIQRKFEIEEKYKERMEKFFYNMENCCEKIYEALKEG